MTDLAIRFKLRRGTAANLASVNETPLAGELVIETDTGKLKLGDGSTAWNSLPYLLAGYVPVTRGTSYTETTRMGELVVLVTGSAVTVTLPSAVNNFARLTFKLTVAGTMTLAAAGGQTIDGGATAVVTAQGTSLTLISDASNWQII